MNKDVPDYALMVGVPARQIGWMSEFGERVELPLKSEERRLVSKCAATGDIYELIGNYLCKN